MTNRVAGQVVGVSAELIEHGREAHRGLAVDIPDAAGEIVGSARGPTVAGQVANDRGFIVQRIPARLELRNRRLVTLRCP